MNVMELKLEIGHLAIEKAIPTADGHTHDFIVFVNGANEHFVEKVVFDLNDSFPRVVNHSPFQLVESGFINFIITIHIHFRTECESQVDFTYHVATTNGEPSNLCDVILHFQDPTLDFLWKLLRGGGLPRSDNNQPMPDRIIPYEGLLQIAEPHDQTEPLPSMTQNTILGPPPPNAQNMFGMSSPPHMPPRTMPPQSMNLVQDQYYAEAPGLNLRPQIMMHDNFRPPMHNGPPPRGMGHGGRRRKRRFRRNQRHGRRHGVPWRQFAL